MSPFVSPISPTWMNSVGSLAKFPTSQTPTSASSGEPEERRHTRPAEPFERSHQCRNHRGEEPKRKPGEVIALSRLSILTSGD